MTLKQWMEKQSSIYKEEKQYLKFSEDISVCERLNIGVHVHKGLEEMAIEVGAELYINEYGFVAFRYDGVEFFQLD